MRNPEICGAERSTDKEIAEADEITQGSGGLLVSKLSLSFLFRSMFIDHLLHLSTIYPTPRGISSTRRATIRVIYSQWNGEP